MEPEIIISTNNLSIKQVVLFANKKIGFSINEKTTDRIKEYRNNLISKWNENKNKFNINDNIYNKNNINNNNFGINYNDNIRQQHEKIKDVQKPQNKPENENLKNCVSNENNVNSNSGNMNLLNESLLIENSSIISNDYINDKTMRASLLIQLNLLCSGTSGISLPILEVLYKRLKEDNLPLVVDNCSNGLSDSNSLAQASLFIFGKSIPLPNERTPKVPQFYGINNNSNNSSNNNNNDDDSGMISNELNKEISLHESNLLINGNCITLASGALLLNDVSNFLNALDTSAAFSMEAYRANLNSLHSIVSKVHNHSGQVQCSNNFQNILNFSKLWSLDNSSSSKNNNNNNTNVSSHDESSSSSSSSSSTTTTSNSSDNYYNKIDPTSFRNVSQIHGAAYTSFDWCFGIFEKEINLSVDNPLLNLSEENGYPISNGNNDTGLLSLSMDTLRSSLCRCILILSQRISKLPWKQFNNLNNDNNNNDIRKQHYHNLILNLCKTASSIVSTIQSLSNAVLNCSHGMQLFEGMEDTSTQTQLSIKNTKLLIEQGWKLITIEIIISIYCIKQRNLTIGSIGFGLRSLFNTIHPLLPWSTSPQIIRSPPLDTDQTTSSFVNELNTQSQILNTRKIQEIIKNYICDNQ